MASTFKRKRDKKDKHAPYWICYRDHTGKRKMVKGFTDKKLSEQLAARLDDEARLRKTGMIDPVQEDLVRRKGSAVEEHLADFERALTRRKNTAKHIRLTMGRVRSVVEGCGFKTLGDLNAEAAEAFLGDKRVAEDLGHRTFNHYIQAIEQFGHWLQKTGRLATNPFQNLTRLNCETDVRRKRRALNPEEFARLIEAARGSNQKIQCFGGETRARIYTLSYLTGLRRGEIGSLTPRSFNLTAEPKTLTIAATISKHRKTDVLPLHPDLVPMLREWTKGLRPDDLLFPRLARRRTWLMVKKDLERAGIPYVTPDGVADFHAAGRHTHITELLRNGASLPEARQLARHSDIKMTMKYTHIGIADQAKALAALPNPCQHIGSISGVPEGQPKTPGVINGQDGTTEAPAATPPGVASSGTEGQKKTPPGKGGVLWRRRESNPRPVALPCSLLRA